jgi:hypothetical protein
MKSQNKKIKNFKIKDFEVQMYDKSLVAATFLLLLISLFVTISLQKALPSIGPQTYNLFAGFSR